MKKALKVLTVLMVALLLVSLCACSYVPSTRFMSRMQVNSLVKEYGTPQAVVTLNYEINSQKVEVKILYNLLLEKTPLATVRFIQLANEGFYDDTVIDTYNSTYKYMIMGRYAYRESELQENKMLYFRNESDVTFKGEFKSNAYDEPSDGYAQFSILSLAMYHDDATSDIENFDKASGALIMAVANKTLNSDNYAVFAEMVSVTLQNNDADPITYDGKVPSQLFSNLTYFTSRSSRNVYDDMTEEHYSSISLMSTRVTIHVEILGGSGDYWSKLPSIGK